VVKQFNAGLQRINFTSRQWKFLGVMVLVNILLLIVLVVLALIFTT
jgi:hypothetical protein